MVHRLTPAQYGIPVQSKGTAAYWVMTVDPKAGEPAFRVYKGGFPACKVQRVKSLRTDPTSRSM